MNKSLLLMLTCVLLWSATPGGSLYGQAKKISFEEMGEQCRGIARKDRVRVSVARFSVSSRAAQASGNFGAELATMLTTALQRTFCFRVLENARQAQDDAAGEFNLGEIGAANGSAAQRGQMLGAQVIFTAEITEYNEGKSNLRLGPLSVGKNKTKIGLIIQAKDPMTRELLWSRPVSAEGKKSGLNGVRLFRWDVAGSTKVSESMSAAVEDVLYAAVELLVKEKDLITAGFDPQEGLEEATDWNSSNCNMLTGFAVPKIMVVLPEYHIQRRIPDPAGETEIIRQLVEAGFEVIDPSVLATIRDGVKFEEAARNPMSAVALGRDFGADIVIFGEAFSEAAGTRDDLVTCRARVEFKAVNTRTAAIMASHGLHAGAQDITESSSAKRALQSAGGLVAQYILDQFCE